MPTPRRKPPQPRTCALPDCGEIFTPKRRDARYCSDQCRWVAAKREKRGTAPAVNPPAAPAAVPARRPAAPVIPPFAFPPRSAVVSPRPAARVDLAAELARRGYLLRSDAPPGGCQVSERQAGPCWSPGPNRYSGARLCDAHAYALGLAVSGLTA